MIALPPDAAAPLMNDFAMFVEFWNSTGTSCALLYTSLIKVTIAAGTGEITVQRQLSGAAGEPAFVPLFDGNYSRTRLDTAASIIPTVNGVAVSFLRF
jgi:hypothetical protein